MRKVILGVVMAGIVLLVVALLWLPDQTQVIAPAATPTLDTACTVLGPGESLSLQDMEAIAKVETQFDLAPGFSIPTVTPDKALPGASCGAHP